MALNISENDELYLPVPGGRYLAIDRDFLDQTVHNGFAVREGRSLGVFVLVSASKAICLIVCPALHTYLHYKMAEKEKLAELPRLKQWFFWRILF